MSASARERKVEVAVERVRGHLLGLLEVGVSPDALRKLVEEAVVEFERFEAES